MNIIIYYLRNVVILNCLTIDYLIIVCGLPVSLVLGCILLELLYRTVQGPKYDGGWGLTVVNMVIVVNRV